MTETGSSSVPANLSPYPWTIRPVIPADRPWIEDLIAREWGAPVVAVHGDVYRPADLPGLVAEQEGGVCGLLTYRIGPDGLEIVTFNCFPTGRGAGTVLLQRAREIAVGAACRRVWLITTNDNLDALRFYQRRGFALIAVHCGAVARARRLKPEIPLTGCHGIPIRDEIELEMVLPDGTP